MLTPAKLKVLKEELANPVLDELSVVAIAREELARGAVSTAVARLEQEVDKFYIAAPVVYKLLKGVDEEHEAAEAQWMREPRQPSPGERLWR